MNKKENTTNALQLISKTEGYIQYMLEIILKLPRTEKFNIGNEYKISMYQMLNKILLLSKIKDKKICLNTTNEIDNFLNCQRIYLRIMLKNKWIDERKFKITIEKIYELGKMVGGLMKYYAKDH